MTTRAMLLVAVVCCAATLTGVSAGRTKTMPPGWLDVVKSQNIHQPSCNGAADAVYGILTTSPNFSPSQSIHKMSAEELKKIAWTDPAKTLCNGADRVIYISMGLGSAAAEGYSHHALLQTYGKGKYAMLYQSYSGDFHKDEQGKSYQMNDYLAVVQMHLDDKDDPKDIGNLPPVVKDLPCECEDMAKMLQSVVDASGNALKTAYNRMFTPQNDKVGVKGPWKAFGKEWRDKDVMHLYKTAEGKHSIVLNPRAFVEQSAAYHMQHRVKTPALLVHLKHQKKQLRVKRNEH